MLNDDEILYIVPFTNVKVEKTALNKDFGGWSILTGEQFLKIYDDFEKFSLKREDGSYYFVKKVSVESKEDLGNKILCLSQEELLLLSVLRALNYNELDIKILLVRYKDSDVVSDCIPYLKIKDTKLLKKYPHIKNNLNNTIKYFYSIKEKKNVLTTSLLKKITPIITASERIPNSFCELLKIWNQSFDINDPVGKTRKIFPIWNELIFSKKQSIRDTEVEFLKMLTTEYPSHCQMMTDFIQNVNEKGFIASNLYASICRLLKFKKQEKGVYKELFALFLGKYIIPMTQKIIWHSLLNLATMGCIYQYIKTEYDDPESVDWSCW